MTELTETSKKYIKYIQSLGLSHTSINHSNKSDPPINIILDSFYKDFFISYFVVSPFLHDLVESHPISIKKITNPSQIIHPKSFSFDSIPREIGQHIHKHIVSEFTFTFKIYHYQISLFFYLEKQISSKKIVPILQRILIWLHMIYTYKQKQTSKSGCTLPKTLQCFFYLTSLKKELPTYTKSIQTLSEMHANTAFTRSCSNSSNINEIVVYRMEEWFKVFIHETMHTFGLDFSDYSMDKLSPCTQKLQNTFLVNSDINLYESYTEFWAEIINGMFCSMFITHFSNSEQDQTKNTSNMLKKVKNGNYQTKFNKTSITLWNVERIFGIIQMNKVLNFMGLTYKDITSHSLIVREKYQEKTSIFSYYILKNMLLMHYEDFFQWIIKNHVKHLEHTTNTLHLPFLLFVHFIPMKSSKNKRKNELEPFCSFLLTHYDTEMPAQKNMHIHNADDNNDVKTLKWKKTMRMTVCELNGF